MFDQRDELDDAVALVAETIEAANRDQPLPTAFPRRLIALFADYGKTLADDEWIEQMPRGSSQPVRYDGVTRGRLQRFADSAYEDHVDLTGTVTMARISNPKMAIELSDGREVEAVFATADEQTITTALKDHESAKVRVVGRGLFSGSGQLQRIAEVSSVVLLAAGSQPFDTSAKPIWEQFAEIIATATPDDLASLPSDGAAKHDWYISGKRRGA
jgi:hypothetical protein